VYQESKIQFECLTICSGDGYWSRQPGRIVRVVSLGYYESEQGWGELKAYFNREDWPNTAGLIYTDRLWLETFKQNLQTMAGLEDGELDKIAYSEQGMQGRDYVSMDVFNFGQIWKKIKK
jgi:hypothetical protein